MNRPRSCIAWSRAWRGLLAALCLVWVAGAPAAPAGGAIASAHPLASEAGHAVLAQGGNAFDAAVAVAAVLAVVEPYSSGLGGGGFWLLHRAADGLEVMIDGRETAPQRLSPELFLDERGEPVAGASTRSGLAVGIPGVPAAFVQVAGRYGRLPLAVSLAPAIHYAREGFAVDPRYVQIVKLRERFLRERPGLAIFLDGGRTPRAGHRLRQPELAATLERLATAGRDGFYSGEVAQSLVAAVNAAGGVWQLSDLSGYRVVEREPVRATYRGARVTAAALPSAGGIALAQGLAMLERFELRDTRAPHEAHLIVEVLRRVFEDRAGHLGDSDHVAVPLAQLTSRSYLVARAAGIDLNAATASGQPVRAGTGTGEGGNTTHLSVIDRAGNRVAATLSLNWLFGSGVVAHGSGVVLNNQMDDFTMRPGVPNSYGLLGSEANAVGPGRRPLSSMTPAFVEDGKGVLVLGAPGGSRIVSQVLLAVLDYVHAREPDLDRILSAPRYHHQWLPDRVEVEPDAFPPEWRAALAAKGHALHTVHRRWGNMQLAFRARADGALSSASDPRGTGVAWY